MMTGEVKTARPSRKYTQWGTALAWDQATSESPRVTTPVSARLTPSAIQVGVMGTNMYSQIT